MKKIEAVRFFGSQRKIAKELGVSEQAVSLWGAVIPEKNALRLHQITNGKLMYDESLYRNSEPHHAGNYRQTEEQR